MVGLSRPQSSASVSMALYGHTITMERWASEICDGMCHFISSGQLSAVRVSVWKLLKSRQPRIESFLTLASRVDPVY